MKSVSGTTHALGGLDHQKTANGCVVPYAQCDDFTQSLPDITHLIIVAPAEFARSWQSPTCHASIHSQYPRE